MVMGGYRQPRGRNLETCPQKPSVLAGAYVHVSGVRLQIPQKMDLASVLARRDGRRPGLSTLCVPVM